jgi:hypothetical protein
MFKTIVRTVMAFVVAFIVFALFLLPATGSTGIKIQCHSVSEAKVCKKKVPAWEFPGTRYKPLRLGVIN